VTHESQVTIPMDHPSIAGHFPGSPVVPGVLMLGEVMAAMRRIVQGGITFVGLPAVKFVSPWIPGERLTIRLESEGGQRMTFTCLADTRLIASGSLEYRAVSHSDGDHE
jgi:3-hydroxyacyl-[acyl-carrier-protein] dehydratase